jgi:hypothetical protein
MLVISARQFSLGTMRTDLFEDQGCFAHSQSQSESVGCCSRQWPWLCPKIRKGWPFWARQRPWPWQWITNTLFGRQSMRATTSPRTGLDSPGNNVTKFLSYDDKTSRRVNGTTRVQFHVFVRRMSIMSKVTETGPNMRPISNMSDMSRLAKNLIAMKGGPISKTSALHRTGCGLCQFQFQKPRRHVH